MKNRLIKAALGLVLAIAMTFVPIMNSYAVTAPSDIEPASVAAEEEADNASEVTAETVDAQADVSEEAVEEEPAVEETVKEEPTAEEAVEEEPASEEAKSADDKQSLEEKDPEATTADPENAATEETAEEETYKKGILSYDGKGYRITVSYGPEAEIPEGASLSVKEITSSSAKFEDYKDEASTAAGFSDEKDEKVKARFFDIKIKADGKEIEPEKSVEVKISFSDPLDNSDSSELETVHFGKKGAEKVETDNIGTSGKYGEVNAVSFAADSFSVYGVIYTVDFTYDGFTYSITGESAIKLSELAEILGIAGKGKDYTSGRSFVREVEEVSFTDESLVKVSKSGGNWILKSLQPFSSTETLTITMKDGDKYVVDVTDNQVSSNLVDFLTNAVITGATQDSEGRYEVEAGKEYNIILSFAESSAHQFDNRSTLTYTMPDGLTILSRQTGDLKINIVYKGRTYQVDATYDLDTNGNLEIIFDENDPDFHHLENSTNVSFRFSYNGAFDGSEKQIHFSQDIERDIVFEEPEPGQAYVTKNGTFDEQTGKFNYTITVKATGDITNVNVKDVISGNALIFNNDVRVSGNSSSYRDNGATNGFDYTFASMREGEVITITYSASVDFSKDDDKDGKISVDQTKNTATVKPEGGEPHTSEYSHEIAFKTTKKSNGTPDGTTADGDKIYKWTITYNELMLASAGGDTIKDTIAAGSTEYMKYYGDGLSIKVTDKNGNVVDTRTVPYSSLQSYSDSSWTYKIPEGDSQPYMYEITYYTVVDMEKVEGTGNTVTVTNDANGSSGSADVTPESVISVTKSVDSFTTEQVNWTVMLGIPEKGLTQAVVTDTFPAIWLNGKNIYDLLKDGSLQITGLLDGESYTVENVGQGQVKITFYQDTGKSITGLKATPGGHTITVKLTTLVDQEWLQAGYESGGYVQTHTNKVDFNGKQAEASVIFGKPGIEKKGDALKDSEGNITGLKYTVVLKGVSETPVSVLDTFDTSILEVDTSKASSWDHMRIWGGNQWSQDAGRMPVSYTDTGNGIILTADTVPMQTDGSYYPYYKIIYYLKVKDGVDLKALAIANGGEYDVDNTVKWGDHESEFTYKVEYDYLDKQLLNEGELGGTSRTAKYQITFNPSKATLNGGEDMTMTDVLSKNLSVDYGSIKIVTDPAGQNVAYSLSGGEGGTTVATYTIPDSTKVTITYDANVRGNGSQTITNKVEVNGKEETVENTKSYGSASEGEGAQASFKIVKVDGYDANKKLQGVRFKIFCENSDVAFNEDGNLKEIILTTDENGEITLDSEQYIFYFDECYHVQEIEPLEDYGQISFDYLVTLTNDMSKVDYGHYIYYYSDSMQIKNWPLEGLVVEKQVESDDPDDLEDYYSFKIYVLNDNESVNTDFNEKSGDDQFENGVLEFQLKAGEQKMFWGFAKGTKYKVEEIDADGFVTTVTYSVYDEDGNFIRDNTEKTTEHSGELTQDDETIVFKNTKTSNGSLKITKNVTVNGAATMGTLADGTYEFTIKGPGEDGEVTKTVTITVSNGVAASATVDGEAAELDSDGYVEVTNLVPGEYTITETDPTNGTSLVGANGKKVTVEAGETAEAATVAFTNNKDVGSLKIKKNVTVNGEETTGNLADGDYEFTVTGPNDYEETVRITIKDGKSSTATLNDLEAGEYTVTETAPTNGTSLVGANGKKVTVEVGAEAAVPTAEFTNDKENHGGLEITKNVTVNGEATTGNLADGTYEFTVTGPKNYSKTVEITIKDGKSSTASLDKLVPGEYTITEKAPTNGTSLVGANGKKVTVEAGETAEAATVAFTNNKDVGSLKIKKNVTVNGEETTGNLADGDYEFTVTGPNDYEETVRITIKDGKSSTATLNDLEAGEYTVTETAPTNGTSLVGANGKKVTVEVGAEAAVPTAEFTNDKENHGGLEITKNVTVNGEATTGNLADGTYEFTVTGPKNYSKTVEITIKDGKSSTASLDKLVPGEYTITEKAPTNGTSLVGANGKKVTVEAGETAEAATVAFTNNKDVGSLKIKKNVTVNGEETTGNLADGDYEFTVTGPNDYEETVRITIKDGKSSTATLNDLEAGEYTVTEKAPTNGTSLVGENGKKVTVEVGAEAAVPTAEFTNDKENHGGLEITKNVTVNGEATQGNLADGTYEFTVTGPKNYSKTVEITIKDGKSSTASLDKLVPGEYTITEKAPTNGTSLVGANGKKVTVEAGETAEAATVAFTNNKDVGSLKIKKNVTVNGEETTGNLADGDYEFTVTGPNDYEETVRITIKDGKSSTATLNDLEAGEYTVTETAPTNGTSLVGANGKKVTVEVGAEAAVPTAEFTNDKENHGGLEITKNVTVNGEATTGNLADGTYEFTVTGPKNYSNTVEITIKDGKSSTASLDKLVPGEYTITEKAPTNGTSLVGANGKKVTVEAGETAEAATVAFTNNKDVGSLKIKKNVTVNGEETTGNLADGDYEFTVTGPNDYEETVRITIKDGKSSTATLNDLEAGEYTVTEKAPTNGTSLVGENGKKVTVEVGAEAAVPTAEFTNDKENHGGLEITKNVTVNGEATQGNLADGTYEFTVTGPKNYSKTVEITIKDGKSSTASLDKLVPGEYTITEKAPTNGTSLVGANGKKVTVEAGETAEAATVAFTNNKDVGSLKIKKNVTVNGEETTGNLADGDYEFTVTGPNDYEETVRITIKDGKSSTATLNDLEAGEYTVTETAPTNGTSLVGANGKKVTVEVGAEAAVPTAEFTNDKENHGGLEITKNVTVNGEATTGNLADGTYEFTVTGPKNYSKTVEITIKDGKSSTASLDKLVPGEYTITEKAPTNGTSLVGANGKKVTVEAGETAEAATVAFTNNKDVGSLKIKKTFVGVPEDANLDSLNFEITDPEGKTTTVTYADFNEDGEYVIGTELPVGAEYTVKETNAEGLIAHYTLAADSTLEGKGTVVKAKTTTIDLTNKYIKNVNVELEVTKCFTGRKWKDADTFTFYLEPMGAPLPDDPDGTIVTLRKPADDSDTESGKFGSIEFNETGTYEYLIGEDIPSEDEKIKGVSYDNGTYTATVKITLEGNEFKADVTYKKDGEPADSAKFTNTYAAKGEGEIKVQKVLKGRDWTNDDQFTFQLYPVGDAPVPETYSPVAGFASITITKEDTDKTKSFGKIKFTAEGTYSYKVKETKGSLGGVTYDEKEHTVTIKVVDDGNGNLVAEEGDRLIKTEKITNKYKASGVGEIKVKKTLEGRKWTNNDKFTFTISAADGTPMPANKSITITKSDKNLTKSFGEIKFTKAGTYTYKVKETKGSIGGVTYDTTEHTVTIEAVDDGKGNIVAKAGSALVQTVEFVNTYEAGLTKGEIKVQKILEGRKWTDDDEFEFTLSAPAGTPMPEEDTITITKDDKDQTVSFGQIVFDEPGKYTYTVKETKGDIKGVTYDTKKHKVTIEVVDDGKGNLVAKDGTKLIQTVKITNTAHKGVKTGDDSNVILYSTTMLGSILAFLFMAIRRRRNRA